MPQAPIIIPIIIAGVTLGSMLATQKRTLSKKKLAGVSLLSGLLNVGNAFLVNLIAPPPSLTRAGGTQFRTAAGAGSEYMFFVSSFLVGVLAVLAIIGIALLYARYKGERPVEDEETKLEET
jgi:hypothetical protein